ncbi:MAG: amidase [Dehalococcoidia bacterium]
MTILEMQAAMTAGLGSSRWLVSMYLDRIEMLDRSGPRLNSIIELNPDALEIADQLDAERKASGPRGPLHGIPVVVKDNLDTGDKMMTTAGSLALQGNYAPRDSHAVKLLRDAGAVILAKANLSEWANYRSTRSTSGWSSRGGRTLFPYALDRNPSGSSSGTGVAVAASLCAAGVGTETTGSIVAPSSRNGLVGIKPTVGLISRRGIIPISRTRDTAGPMTRTVEDCAVLFDAMCGEDPEDEFTAGTAGRLPSAQAALSVTALQGKRIGVVRNLLNREARVDRLIDAVVAVLRQLGAEVVDELSLELTPEFRKVMAASTPYEFKHGINEYLASVNAPAKTLSDIIAFNQANAGHAMPYFGQERLIEADAYGPISSPAYQESMEEGRRLARELIDAPLRELRLDALIGPTNLPANLTDLVNGDYRAMANDLTTPAAVAAYPHVTVPCGDIHGLPIGLSLVGTAFDDVKLLSYAYAYEQATKLRKPPTFPETIRV